MIGWLAGHVHHHQGDAVVVEVAGVGYDVRVASSEELRVGDPVGLYVHTVVRADAIVLYGFSTREERAFFDLLLATPGVGPATALGALRTMPLGELAATIEAGDVKRIAQIPGVGPKTASRIVLELKGKVVLADADPAPVRADGVEDALRSLGYSGAEIRDALSGVELSGDEATALREALHLLRRT